MTYYDALLLLFKLLCSQNTACLCENRALWLEVDQWLVLDLGARQRVSRLDLNFANMVDSWIVRDLVLQTAEAVNDCEEKEFPPTNGLTG